MIGPASEPGLVTGCNGGRVILHSPTRLTFWPFWSRRATFMHMGLEVKVIGLQGRSYVFVIKTLYKPINADACHVAASKTKKNILITLQARSLPSVSVGAALSLAVVAQMYLAACELQMKQLQSHQWAQPDLFFRASRIMVM